VAEGETLQENPAEAEDTGSAESAASEATAENKPEQKLYQVGDVISDRFKITKILDPMGSYPHYRATDKQNQDHVCVLSQIGKPTKSEEPDKVKRGLERATRNLSWIRHPGFVTPKEFIQHDGLLFSIFPDVNGVFLDEYLKKNQPPISKMVYWLNEIAAMLDQIHEARQPQFLGQLPLRNVVVNQDGEVQLLGFDLNPSLKLDFLPVDDSAPKAPDSRLDARSDVWCLGKMLEQMVDVTGDAAKKSYREEKDLRSLVQLMVADSPDKRVANMSTLKSRLERMRWKDSPRPAAVGVMESPITVLTVEEQDQFRAVKQKFKVLVGITILVILVVALLGQTLFPDSGGF